MTVNTMNITLAKVSENITEEGLVRNLKTQVFPIPNYVVDTEFHADCVQAFLNHINECDVNAQCVQAQTRFNSVADKYAKGTATVGEFNKAEDKLNDCKVLASLYKNYLASWKSEMLEKYEDISELLDNNIARFQAISIFGKSAYKDIRDKDGKQTVTDIKFSFNGMVDFANTVRKFGDEANTLNKEEKSALLTNVNTLFNHLFAPSGGDVYKNRTWKMSANQIMTLLYARSKKALRYGSKGTSIDDKKLDNFELLMQGYLISLSFSGIPLTDGNGVEHVLDVTMKQEVAKPRRRNKKSAGDSKTDKTK